MKRLVIAEKPSVAMSIAAAIGAKEKKTGYLEGRDTIVSWCVGHLAALVGPEAYSEKFAKWNRADLPIIPGRWQYKVPRDKHQQFEILRWLMGREDVCEIVNACDAGREGELIFRNMYAEAGCAKPVLRLWISSMEKPPGQPGVRQPLCRRPVPGVGRLAGGYQRDPAFLRGLPPHVEGGPGHVSDPCDAGGARGPDQRL